MHDTTDGPAVGTLEIKCPFTARVVQACQTVQGFCPEIVDGKPTLKKNRNYYYQVQGAMAIVSVKWCDFLIWMLP